MISAAMLLSRIEILEARIAPATLSISGAGVLTYTEGSGVARHVHRGGRRSREGDDKHRYVRRERIHRHETGANGEGQLLALNLGAEFEDAKITFKAKPQDVNNDGI